MSVYTTVDIIVALIYFVVALSYILACVTFTILILSRLYGNEITINCHKYTIHETIIS